MVFFDHFELLVALWHLITPLAFLEKNNTRGTHNLDSGNGWSKPQKKNMREW